MKIKTTQKMRVLYAKHLNKLYDYAKRNFKDNTCYLCEASRDSEDHIDCQICPLSPERHNRICCGTKMRKINLRDKKGNATNSYENATSKSINKHNRWIEKQIEKYTDCEFEWEK